MADQVINGDTDIIQNVVASSWQRGACPPEWAEPTVLLFSDNNLLQFSDGAILAFKEY